MSRFNLQRILRLREMLRKWRRLTHQARSVRSSSSSSSREMVGGRTSCRVPAGHLAVYVGQERKRFVIKTSLLTHPLFKALLKKTEKEIGFHYEGGLTLPCDVSSFQHLLLLMQSNSHHASHNIIHHAHGEHLQHVQYRDIQEHNHPGFLHLLRELLHLHFTDSSAPFANRCLSGPPLTSLLVHPVSS